MTDLSSIAPRRLPDPSTARPAGTPAPPRNSGRDGGFSDMFDTLRDADRPLSGSEAGDARPATPPSRDADTRAGDGLYDRTTGRDGTGRAPETPPASPSGRNAASRGVDATQHNDPGSETADDAGTADDPRRSGSIRATDAPVAAPIAAVDTLPPPRSGTAPGTPDGATQVSGSGRAGGLPLAGPAGAEPVGLPAASADGAPPGPQATAEQASAQAAAARTTRDGGARTARTTAQNGAQTGTPIPDPGLAKQASGSGAAAEPPRPGTDTAPSADAVADQIDGDMPLSAAGSGPDPRAAPSGPDAAARLRLTETAARAAAPDAAGSEQNSTPAQITQTAQTVPPAPAPGFAPAHPAPMSPGPLGAADGQAGAVAIPFALTTEAADWMDRLVERIGSGVAAGLDEIEMTLTPRNLGTLTVRIDMRDTAASVAIVTETPEAARLFNDQQGKLAELLTQSGLSLGDHRAGTGDGAGPRGQAPATGPAAMAGTGPDSPQALSDMSAPARHRAGLVDLLA